MTKTDNLFLVGYKTLDLHLISYKFRLTPHELLINFDKPNMARKLPSNNIEGRVEWGFPKNGWKPQPLFPKSKIPTAISAYCPNSVSKQEQLAKGVV